MKNAAALTEPVQQGEVLLFPEESLPAEATKVEPVGGRHVLAQGTATGHAHAISDIAGSSLYRTVEGVLWLQASHTVDLQHEEHRAVPIPAGTYRVGIARTVDPYQRAIQAVQD